MYTASHGISFFLRENWVHNRIYNNLKKAQEFWSDITPCSSLTLTPAWAVPALSPSAIIYFLHLHGFCASSCPNFPKTPSHHTTGSTASHLLLPGKPQ